MSAPAQQTSPLRRLLSLFGWTRSSSVLLGGFFLVVILIVYIWWPLAEEVLAYVDWGGPWWLYMDWLLVGIFAFMSLTIMAHADLRRDALIVFVATLGGLVIESWGTQTNLWHYYTAERPPLWIVPAWPVATLAIDRLVRIVNHLVPPLNPKIIRLAYWSIFIAFFILMLVFTRHTLDKPFTWFALFIVGLLILSPGDRRTAVLTFLAGAGLGYFLEVWGTTRQCWTYYTGETPPVFAVLAHGLAASAFWRGGSLVRGAIISTTFKLGKKRGYENNSLASGS